MKLVVLPVLLASTLAALCLATFARAQDVIQDVFVASGIRYRVSAVSSPLIGMSLQAVPEVPLAAPNSARALPLDEQLSRCDEFVALALEARGLAGSGDARLVRDRVEPRPGNRSWVLYAQRHQGHRILGAGGRLEVDSYGGVPFAGLNYETEKLRDFRPMASARLAKLAASAVPHPRVGPPVFRELMIDPLVLLCHKVFDAVLGTWPHQVQGICCSSERVRCLSMVAIDAGRWRSGRTGSAPRLETTG